MLKQLSIAAAGATLGLTMLVDINPAQAASLTTIFAADNGLKGNMFDVTTFDKDLKITGLDINLNSSPPNSTVNLYTKSGTYEGFETDPSAWTLVSTNIVSGAGFDNATFVDITDFKLDANSITAFYVDTSANLFYTTGTAPGQPTFSNDDLSIATGVGKTASFGATVPSRTWNGTIYYEEHQSTPEPASILGLLTIGAIAATSIKGKKNEKV